MVQDEVSKFTLSKITFMRVEFVAFAVLMLWILIRYRLLLVS